MKKERGRKWRKKSEEMLWKRGRRREREKETLSFAIGERWRERERETLSFAIGDRRREREPLSFAREVRRIEREMEMETFCASQGSQSLTRPDDRRRPLHIHPKSNLEMSTTLIEKRRTALTE